MEHPHFVVAFTGNPQTGKDILFRKLTFGRWAGRDARRTDMSFPHGSFHYGSSRYRAVDLPGIQSLSAPSEEASNTVDYICSGHVDVIAVTGHALELEHLLYLLKEILCLDQVRDSRIPVVLCISRCDEAIQRGVVIDFALLHDVLQIPVVPLHGFGREQIDDLKAAFHYSVQPHHKNEFAYDCLDFSPGRLANECMLTGYGLYDMDRTYPDGSGTAHTASAGHLSSPGPVPLTGSLAVRAAAVIIRSVLLVSLLCLIFTWAQWLTDRLWPVFFQAEENLAAWAAWAGAPLWLTGCIIQGAFRSACWMVLIVLPPLLLFFPLVGLLEETGFLPMPGSLPPFLVKPGRIRLSALLYLGAAWMLSYTFPGTDHLCYPQAAVPHRYGILPSFFRSTAIRTLPVLNHAALAAVPAGILVWLLGSIAYTGPGAGYLAFISSGQNRISLLAAIVSRLDIPARLIGLDGAILAAFLLGFLAQELALPALIMAYLQTISLPALQGTSILSQILISQGWTGTTVLCAAIFTVFHWPSVSACLDLHRQTGSARRTAAAFLFLPLIGIILCMAVTQAAGTR